MDNPFDVQTPENLSTNDMLQLFVSENTDIGQVEKAGHTFITGPRGSGKSMFFRYMEPDCQCNSKGISLPELDYYAAYVPVKENDLKISELGRLEVARHANIVLNEHFLINHVASKLFVSLSERSSIQDVRGSYASEVAQYFSDVLSPLLLRSGWTCGFAGNKSERDVIEHFKDAIELFDNVSAKLNTYFRKLAFADKIVPYEGALFGYSDFLVPLVKGLKELSFMPKGPIFLLIDDADNLNNAQAMILNSWVARRTTGFLCFKVSAQEGEYKTDISSSGQRIEAPHDFSNFNISDKYTTNADNFKRRLRDIVEKRFKLSSIEASAENFFPEYEKQENKIKEIGKEFREKWESEGRGNRPGDDVLRYARPEFIRRIRGTSKSGPTYSYSGFSQLVHLSSGIIRHFLESASWMYAEAISREGGKLVSKISPTIQDEIIRKYSNQLFFYDFNKVEAEVGEPGVELDKPALLKNMITALGGMFNAILMNETRSERRVFSIAFSNGPDSEVKEILRLGVKYGYLHSSTIGNKEGTGRVPLYILTRRLAPTFGLDPTGFAGYKFVQNNAIKKSMRNPQTMIRLVATKGFNGVMDDDSQGSLFGDG